MLVPYGSKMLFERRGSMPSDGSQMSNGAEGCFSAEEGVCNNGILQVSAMPMYDYLLCAV